MSSPLQIPQKFRDFRFKDWTNAFDFLPPNCPRFYPTETLFGDWHSSVLLLAKDAAPSCVMRKAFANEGIDGWRHAQKGRDRAGYRTNERLVDLVRTHKLPTPLYGSAAAHMLYDDPRFSRNLRGFYEGALHDHLADVLRWVIGRMPNIRTIGCLGVEAWYLTSVVLEHPCTPTTAAKNAAKHRDAESIITGYVNDREISASCHFHPSARVSKEQLNAGWSGLAARVNMPR
jgi:hypothetical protein